MADENNTGDEQFTPDGSMEPLSPQEADTTDYGLMDTGERIQRKDLQQEMRESYLAYALSVIVERALPDVRDGMKPVHRRVIYAMYDGGYRPDRGYNKCSRVVGDVMGKYHPHGDSAIYDTLVRMAQSWSMRNMLVDGQGNFGSPGDDPAAAMRYTECRMAPLAMEMVRDIDKDTVDFVPNYDGKTQEPTVLPARFPNLLVNGSSGIAVGMATNIPPHNMREVADGVHWALDHPEAQTRWEALDALAALATTCPDQLGDAFEGAETALFDEISSTLRYAAFRLLCVWGATSVERSREAWPILDEAIQCYHGDLEYRDMLGCLYEFGQGEIDAEVAEKLALRLKFDAENGKGSYLKARSSEICEMLVKRFGLDLSKKKKRASVKKSDDAEDEE